MKWLLPALATPLYLLLDHLGALPPSLRDRPWPLALAATLLAVFSKRRTAALLVLLASLATLGDRKSVV